MAIQELELSAERFSDKTRPAKEGKTEAIHTRGQGTQVRTIKGRTDNETGRKRKGEMGLSK